MAKIKVKIRNRTIEFNEGTSKADIARTLFEDNAANYTTNEVAKAVPMAYSQAMTIHNKMGMLSSSEAAKPKRQVAPSKAKVNPGIGAHTLPRSGYKHAQEDLETIAKRDVPTARQLAKSAKIKKSGVTARVGKLRTPGHSGDIDVGTCANCGHDLVVRKGPQFMLVHVNTTAEEYLATTQFCTAVPKVLVE